MDGSRAGDRAGARTRLWTDKREVAVGAHFKSLLVEQICDASGGPCEYAGKDMKSAHRGMGISGAHFDALVGNLVAALDTFKVGAHEKDQLLAALGPMKGDIVAKK